ncbi:hypothetical protein TW65_05715 [Stemphylium lycopersici]|uniref:Uncharacterized protein n=1 Tax=Stemphylium lycopersici TaxID=183478 RepID=A0A364MSK2_STELY|nr:hypothetical protein TW65_05715 [Stemphylium lycopersici]RAR01993.1 hypothetical protein DDE83_008731 [Stemphylium lycopersici]
MPSEVMFKHVEIVLGPKDEERIVPLFDDPSIDADLDTLTVSRTEVVTEDCEDKYDRSCDCTSEPDGYQPPPSLIIENEDGRSITLRQVVIKDEIKKVLRKTCTMPKDKMVFCFHGAWPNENEDGSIRMPVKLMA